MPSSLPSANNLKKVSQNQPKEMSGLKRFYPLSLRRTGRGWQVQVKWGQLVISAVLVLSLGWLGLASSAYVFVKYRRGFSDVKFTDMLMLPVRWQAYQVAKGDFFIKAALEQLKAEKYREAFYDLRVGISKSPANKEGRLLLAQFYGLWKRSDLAQLTLLEGLPYHRNEPDYLKVLFSFLLQRQEDERILALCKDLLGEDTTPSARNQLIGTAAATASFFRGNYDQAEDYMRTFNLASTRDGRLLMVRITWERGLKDLALTQMSQLTAEFPNDEEIYAQNVSYLREAGRDDDARRESFLRSIANPNDARARIDLLYELQKEGDTRSLKANVDELFQDFSSNGNALLALADFAANTGDSALARRVYDYARSHNLPWDGAALMMIEANIVSKKYQPALELVRQLLKDNPEWGRQYYVVFNGLQAIAHYGLGDAESAQLFLNNFLSQNTVRADNLIAVSKRLMDVGAQNQAQQVLVEAVKADPLNQAALSGLIKLDLQLNHTDTLADNVRTLLTMRKPSREILSSAYRKLGSDLFLFAPDRMALLEYLRKTITADPESS